MPDRKLTELPSFLSTVSMVVDNRAEIVKGFTRAERKSPSVYDSARELFFSVLRRQFTFEMALDQARLISDKVKRDCAVQVLEACKTFLRDTEGTEIGQLEPLYIDLPNGLVLPVSPVWVRHFAPERLLVLHLWRAPLTDRQVRALKAVLIKALLKAKSRHVLSEIDVFSVAMPDNATSRKSRLYTSEKYPALDNDDFERFVHELCEAWTEYQRQPVRKLSQKKLPLFD